MIMIIFFLFLIGKQSMVLLLNMIFHLNLVQDGSFNWIKLSFVGGVSDGQYGLAMMDTAYS